MPNFSDQSEKELAVCRRRALTRSRNVKLSMIGELSDWGGGGGAPSLDGFRRFDDLPKFVCR